MECYFTHEGLLPLLFGPVPTPTDHRHLEDFLDTSDHVYGHMIMHVSRSLWFHVEDSDPPHCVWSILQSLYGDPSHTTVVVVVVDSFVSSTSSCDGHSTDIDLLDSTSDDEDCASSSDVESTTEKFSPLSLTILESVDISHIS